MSATVANVDIDALKQRLRATWMAGEPRTGVPTRDDGNEHNERHGGQSNCQHGH
jgi:hypothetical protein